MRDKTNEHVGDIHHSATEITRQAFLCMQEQRVGAEWLRKIKHANERITLMIGLLEKEKKVDG